MAKRRFVKVSGYVATAIFFIVGITLSTLKIPTVFHPWILLASIVWIVVFSSGVFSS